MSQKPQHALEPTGVSTTETIVERTSLPSTLYAPTPIKERLRFDDEAIVPRREATTATIATTTAASTSSPTDSSFDSSSSRLSSSPPTPSSLPLYIPFYGPEQRVGRTLVVCFDGTGDQFDSDNSNIVALVSMLKKDDKTKQMVYYQAGIGTYIQPAIATPLASKISKTLDEMLAWNLDAHVMGGYEFLMQNYIAGDKICIFGFSRGSYTAQSLAGMIHKVGLLPADNHQQVPFAYKMYTRTDAVGWNQSNSFKKAFSVDVQIEFLGVWDTVASVGLFPKRLPFTSSNTIVNTFRHAVALDERRAKFKANLWNRPTKEEQKLGIKLEQRAFDEDEKHEKKGRKKHEKGGKNDDAAEPNKTAKKPKKSKFHRGTTLWTLDNDQDIAMNRNEAIYSDRRNQPTDIEEVWFAGCHCDIGGGSVANGTRYSLARIPLRWMVRECFKSNSGILFLTDSLREIGLDPGTLYPYVLPRPPSLLDRAKNQMVEKSPPSRVSGLIRSVFTSAEKKKLAALVESEKRSGQLAAFISEEDEELRDALSPKYDQLKIKRSWWFLELLPVTMRYQKSNDEWVSSIGINMGKPRIIPSQHRHGVKIHRSVQLRMEARCQDGGKYQPKPKINVEPTWID